MSFADAVRSAYKNYVNFNGRARRSEFWYFFLFVILVDIALEILSGVFGGHDGTGGLGLIFSGILVVFWLATFLPQLAITVRRLHDTDRSGWWIFIGLIPIIGGILLLVWYCTPGTPGQNKFGADPKGTTPANVASVF